MQTSVRQIIAIYCLCDDFLLVRDYKDAPQAKLTTAQVMTVALVASALFSGNQERSRVFLKEHGYIQPILSKGASTAACIKCRKCFGKPCSLCWPRCIKKATKASSTLWTVCPPPCAIRSNVLLSI